MLSKYFTGYPGQTQLAILVARSWLIPQNVRRRIGGGSRREFLCLPQFDDDGMHSVRKVRCQGICMFNRFAVDPGGVPSGAESLKRTGPVFTLRKRSRPSTFVGGIFAGCAAVSRSSQEAAVQRTSRGARIRRLKWSSNFFVGDGRGQGSLPKGAHVAFGGVKQAGFAKVERKR